MNPETPFRPLATKFSEIAQKSGQNEWQTDGRPPVAQNTTNARWITRLPNLSRSLLNIVTCLDVNLLTFVGDCVFGHAKVLQKYSL